MNDTIAALDRKVSITLEDPSGESQQQDEVYYGYPGDMYCMELKHPETMEDS